MAKQPEQPKRDSTAREVDRLLRQLPGADPSLASDPHEPPPSPQVPPRPQVGPRTPLRPPTPAGPTPRDRWSTWGLVAGGMVLGGALTQWPYEIGCGWRLYGYLAAVLALLVTAGWAAIAAWGIRSATAHTLALVVAFWGIVLAAEQILPRVGYAAERQWWSCGAVPQPAPAAPIAPALPVVADSTVPADSAAVSADSADAAGP